MKYSPRHPRLVAVLFAAISASASIQAQTAPSPAQPAQPANAQVIPNTPATPDEEVLVLSPFEVTATSDTKSYTA